MFASKSLLEHVLRGVVGIAALACSMALLEPRPLFALALFGLGLFSLRGCPSCWTLGLIETLRGRSAACKDGSCAISSTKLP